MTVPPLLWAGNAVVGRFASDLISPLLLNTLRWVGAGLLLAPLGWRVFADPRSRQRIARHAGYFALLGLLGVGAFNALQYTALKTTSAINATLILASGPVWSLAIGALLYRKPIQRPEVLGALLSVAGVGVVISGGQLAGLMKLQLVPGDLILLVAVIGWSFYTWMLARPPAGLKDDGAPDWNWAEALMVQIVIGAAWATLAAGLQQGLSPEGIGQPSWGWPLAAVLVYVMVLPSIVAYRCWSLGVQRAGPTLATFFANLAPVFAALMSTALLGEAPGWHHALAFALIVGGIATSMQKPSTR